MTEAERLRAILFASLPVHRRRVEQAQDCVARALSQMTHPYIAFSTGKDSLCAAHLVWSVNPAVPAVYFDAACAFPESDELLDRMRTAGYPIIRWSCEALLDTFAGAGGPDAPGIERRTMESTVYAPIRSLLADHHYDGVFLGLRADESDGRAALVRYRGQLFPRTADGLWECLPIARWQYDDVWAFIVSQGLDYNRVYDRMGDLPERERRVSYWAGETNRSYGRWVWLRREYPELFNRFAARFPEVRGYG